PLQPVVEAADQHGMVRQVEHRAGAEGGQQLALADLAMRPSASACLHASSSSIAMSSRVRSQTLTLGSTSRMERFALNFWCRAESFFSSGSRKSCSNHLAPPTCSCS